MSELCPCHFPKKIDCERNILALIGVYSVEVCESRINESDDRYPKHRDGLCCCIRFHAGQAVESCRDIGADELVRSLRDGHIPGGDPLRDCVLAKSMLLNDRRAPTVFERDYLDYLTGVARQVHVHFGNDPDEWWNEFVDFLAGYTHAKGKLEKYYGKSALRFWLRVVLWNFLKRRPIHGPDIPEEMLETLIQDESTKSHPAEWNEEIESFTILVRKTLETLSPRDRLLLSLVYVDNLLKKDIAAMFRVHPGQIGRWQESTLDRFRTSLSEQIESRSRKEYGDSVLEGVAEHPREFANILVETLKTLRANDQVP